MALPGTDTCEHVEMLINHRMDRARKKLDYFQKRFAEDALNAFEWSQDAFSGAADMHAAKTALAYLFISEKRTATDKAWTVANTTDGVIEYLKRISAIAYERAIHEIRWPTHSTTQPHNIAQQEKGRAFYELYTLAEGVQWRIKYEKFTAAFVSGAREKLRPGPDGTVQLQANGKVYTAYRKTRTSKFYEVKVVDPTEPPTTEPPKIIGSGYASLPHAVDAMIGRAATDAHEALKEPRPLYA